MDVYARERSFWKRVEQAPSGCWLWTGGTRANGYGSFAIRVEGGRWTQTTAHRWAYQDQVGTIPTGWEIDHLCRTRNCVRPDHLEAVPLRENRRRRDEGHEVEIDTRPLALPSLPPLPTPPPKRDPSVECRNGHLYAEVGRVANGPGRWTCRACREAQYAAKRKGGAHGTETHCPQGHPYDDGNTYVRTRPNGSKQRECRTCTLRRNRESAKRRAGRS